MASKMHLRVLIYAVFSFFILSINFTNYSILADGVIRNLGLTFTQSGLVLSIAALSYAAVQIPSGMANDRYGGKRVLAVSLVVVILAGLGFSAARSYEVVLITRIVLGLGAGSIITSCIKLLSANVPTDRMDRATGIFGSGWGLGFIFTFLVIPPVMLVSGWRGGLYLTAGLSFLLLAIMPLILRGVETGVVEKSENFEPESTSQGAKIVSRNLIACILLNFTALSVSVGTMTWAALYLQDKYHITLVVAGMSAAVIGIANFFGALMSGVASERLGRRTVIIMTMVGCVAAPILLLPSNLLYLDMAIIASIGWFGMFYFGPVAAIVTTSVDKRRVGLAFGVFNTLGFTGSFFSPLMLGYVLDVTGNYDTGFLILGLTALIGIVAILLMKGVER